MAAKRSKSTSRTRPRRSSKKDGTNEDDYRSGRALWTGTLSFGLISIPVRLVTALRDTGVHFHRVSPDGSCRLRQRLYCPESGKEYDFGESARGYEIAPDQYVIVDEEELAALRPEGGHHFEIRQFVELTEIDPFYFDRPYYLVPDKNGDKPYELLRQTLLQSDKAALGAFSFHEKEYISVVRADTRTLRVQTLRYSDQIVAASSPTLDRHVKISKQEAELAEELIQTLTKPFRPDEFVDHSKEEMKKLLAKKSKRATIHVESTRPKATSSATVVDLMSRLKASLRKQQTGGGKTKRSKSRSAA